MKKVIEIWGKFDPPPKDNIVEPSRRFVYEGKLRKITSTINRETVFFVFNDILVYAYEQLNEKLLYKGTIKLGPCWIKNLDDTEKVKNQFQIVAPNKAYTVVARDLAYKNEFINILTTTIDSLVAKDPKLKEQRSTTIKLTPRNPMNPFTYKLEQFDPESANMEKLNKEIEKTPLIADDTPQTPRRSVSAVVKEEESSCCCNLI